MGVPDEETITLYESDSNTSYENGIPILETYDLANGQVAAVFKEYWMDDFFSEGSELKILCYDKLTGGITRPVQTIGSLFSGSNDEKV